jgi:hypothetical protein
MINAETRQILSQILAMIENVTKELKKGLSEADYKNALLMELQENDIRYTTEETITISYKGRGIGHKRLDICLLSLLPIIFELKAVSSDIKPENIWQLLNYMMSKKYAFGILVNFNQSPGRPWSHRFLIIEDEVPYLYDLKTETKTALEGHCF